MQTLCAELWRRRLSVARLQTAVGFSDDELTVGCGTVLLAPERDHGRAHDRMVALLVVAGRGHLLKAALQQLDVALDEWRRGDRALAAIRLAFVRLPRVRDLDEAHTLFLAETALDAGLRPNDLLRELGHAACLPLLKDWRAQPRVPAGCGRPSGQWTCDASGISFVPNAGPASFQPVADPDGTLKPTPVFLRPQDEDADTHDIEDKQRRSGFEEFDANRIEEGRALAFPLPGPIGPTGPRSFDDEFALPTAPIPPQAVPGEFQILSGPDAGVGEANPGAPSPSITTAPIPKPALGSGGSSGDDTSRENAGPPCPTQQDDIANGPNESGDNEEYRLSWRINPESPTPKYSTWTPNTRSKAYFLSSQTPRGRISFDDCKQRNTPTTLPIPNLRRGDLFEIKGGKWGWELLVPKSAGYNQFKEQVKNQNAAVVAEDLGRQIYYCLPNQKVVDKVKELYDNAPNRNSHFLICP